MPSPSTTMRLVVGSHNMDGRPWDASRLATWLHPTGALDAADEPSPRGADVVCVALQDADEGAVGALAAFFELDVVAARRAGALRVVVLARGHLQVSVAETAQAQIPGADPERHGCLGARVDVLGVSGRHAASLAFVCCHLPPGEARAARRSRALRDCARDLGDDFFDGCDHVLFAGDLNYRLCATSSKMRTRADAVEQFRALAAAGRFRELARHDELDRERAAGRCFAAFDAVDVGAAAPTVAYAGAPAYADRVLWRSRPGAPPLKAVAGAWRRPDVASSRHAPVRAAFDVALADPGEAFRNDGARILYVANLRCRRLALPPDGDFDDASDSDDAEATVCRAELDVPGAAPGGGDAIAPAPPARAAPAGDFGFNPAGAAGVLARIQRNVDAATRGDHRRCSTNATLDVEEGAKRELTYQSRFPTDVLSSPADSARGAFSLAVFTSAGPCPT